MYNVTARAKELLNNECRQTVDITLEGTGEALTITEADISLGGLTIDRASVSGAHLEIGAAIASELSLNLDNHDGRFDDVTFEGAELFVRIGVPDPDGGATQNIPCGYFTVDEPPRRLATISLSALDRMVMFDKKVDWSRFTFPLTVRSIIERTCTICGVPLSTDLSTLPNYDRIIAESPDRDVNYRQIIQWGAEITGTCAFINWDGQLIFSWYNAVNQQISPSERYTSDMLENDIVISGVQILDGDDSYLAGSDNYAFVIDNNPLIQGNYQAVANAINSAVGGFTYRPYECTIKPFIYLYPLDVVEYVDKDGVSHNGAVTNITFTMNGGTSIQGQGETETAKGYAALDPLTAREIAILQKMQTEQRRELSEAEQSLLELNKVVSNSLGLYRTEITENGATVYYYHDAATLADSNVIYTFRAGGFAWTNDWNGGNPVWQYGITRDGNAVLNTLSSYKIISDYINAGAITTDKIAAGAVTAAKADVSGIITAGRANIETIIANKVDATYVNALNVTAAAITIKSGNNTIFSASGSSVRIAGYTVDSNSIYSGNSFSAALTSGIVICRGSSGSASIGGSGNINGWAFAAGGKFGVTKDGKVFASDMVLTEGSELYLGGGTSANDPYMFFGSTSAPHYPGSGRVVDIGYTANGATTHYFEVLVDGVGVGGNQLRPESNGTINLGNANYRWKQLYATTSTINTSDETTKANIKSIDNVYGAVFDELEPIQYTRVGGDRVHMGFGAQSVEAALLRHGLTSMDFAALCYDDIEGEDGDTKRVYGLRYSEFIPLCVSQIQKLKAKINTLEARIAAQE